MGFFWHVSFPLEIDVTIILIITFYYIINLYLQNHNDNYYHILSSYSVALCYVFVMYRTIRTTQ